MWLANSLTFCNNPQNHNVYLPQYTVNINGKYVCTTYIWLLLCSERKICGLLVCLPQNLIENYHS